MIFGFLVLVLVPNFGMMDTFAQTPGDMYASTARSSPTQGAVFVVSQTGPTLVETLVGDPTAVAGTGLAGLAFDSTVKLYAVTAIGINPGTSNLLEINPTNGALIQDFGTIVDSTTAIIRISDLSVQPGTDVIFGVTAGAFPAGIIYTISRTTPPIATLVGSTGVTGLNECLLPFQGKLKQNRLKQ